MTNQQITLQPTTSWDTTPFHPRTSSKDRKRPKWLLVAISLGLWCSGFSCSPTISDCLDSTDCAIEQTCQNYRCARLTPECKNSRDCLPQQLCQQGKYNERSPTCQPQKEICDNKDNDCDGKIDKGKVSLLIRATYQNRNHTNNTTRFGYDLHLFHADAGLLWHVIHQTNWLLGLGWQLRWTPILQSIQTKPGR